MNPYSNERSVDFFDCDLLFGTTFRSQHFGLDGGATNAEMIRCGIGRALVFSFAVGPCAWIAQNRKTREVSLGNGACVPCYVLPQYGPSLGETVLPAVEALLAKGARCFRLDSEVGPASGPLTLMDFPDSAAIWRCLEENRIPVLIPSAHFPETGRRFGYTLDEVVALCGRYPKLPVVLLSPSYSLEGRLALAMKTAANLHCTITRLGLFGQLEAFVRLFGAGRFLFGSGLPFNDPSIACGIVRYANLPDADKRLIGAGNLERLLSNHD